MIEPFNIPNVYQTFIENITSNRLVEFDEIDIEGHCIVCEQPLDDYHLKECEYAGCSICGRQNCICN